MVSMNLLKTKVVVSGTLELLPKIEICIGTRARNIHIKLSTYYLFVRGFGYVLKP